MFRFGLEDGEMKMEKLFWKQKHRTPETTMDNQDKRKTIFRWYKMKMKKKLASMHPTK